MLIILQFEKEPTGHKEWQKNKTRSPSSKNLQKVGVLAFSFFVSIFPISCNHQYLKMCTKKSSLLNFELHRTIGRRNQCQNNPQNKILCCPYNLFSVSSLFSTTIFYYCQNDCLQQLPPYSHTIPMFQNIAVKCDSQGCWNSV